MNESKPLYQLCEEWREPQYVTKEGIKLWHDETWQMGREAAAGELEAALRAWDAELTRFKQDYGHWLNDVQRQILGIKP